MRDDILALADTLLSHKLTANQFMFIYLKLRNKDETLYRYLETIRPLSSHELYDLEERGFIINLNRSANDYWADQYVVAKRFIETIEPYLSMANEFWEAYPGYAVTAKMKVPLKPIPKEDFLYIYAFYVRDNRQLHHRIMRALRYSIGKNAIQFTIARWFESQSWVQVEQELERLRTNPSVTK